ncbi:MAG: sigma-70 family RNA polymerase sigma factor [Phycisphaerae bacterium]
MNDANPDATQILNDAETHDHARIADRLFPIVYDELRNLAAKALRSERANHTLQPTALVHEVFLKLVDQSRVDWKGRTHFFAVGAQAMRRILIDHARGVAREKRGGQWNRVDLSGVDVGAEPEVDVEGLENVLSELATLDPVQAQIVELRFFGGLTVDDVAQCLGVSKRKVEGDWTHAKAWLRTRLAADDSA